MIFLNIEAANLTELREKVAQALGDVLIPVSSYQSQLVSIPPVAVVSKPKPVDAPLPIIEPTPVLADPAPAVLSPSGIDYDHDVKPVVLAVSQKFGRPGIEDLLRPFDVSNAKQVPAERYAELIDAANKALEN